MNAFWQDHAYRKLLLVLALGGGVLLTTAVPGVFIADEDQYLSYAVAVRQGELAVHGTAKLPRATGLAYFSPTDPTPRPVAPGRINPVRYAVSPLYAFIAAPFSWLGWRGLVFLNVFGFCLAVGLVFSITRRWSRRSEAPWLAAGAFALGSFSLEYAQGVWPHMLSVGICMACFWFAMRQRETGRLLPAVAAGLLGGIAFGVRLQDVLFAGGVGLGFLLLSKRRWRTCTAYVAGLALPVGACSLINHFARDSWLPLARGVGYFDPVARAAGSSRAIEWLFVLWAKVVDYTQYPALPGLVNGFMHKDPASGATLLAGGFKKALLQSAPWIAIPLVALVAAWAWRRAAEAGRRGDEAAAEPRVAGRGLELRAIALVVFPTLLGIALKGFAKHNGLAFNQRYMLEITPLVAIALAWALDRFELPRRELLGGVLLGAFVWLGSSLALPRTAALVVAMRVPLLLAAAALVGWWMAARGRSAIVLPLALGACFGWAATIHVSSDLAASWRIRARNRDRMAALEDVLGDHSALFAFWGNKDAFGPLQLDRDLLIVDSSPDEPATLRRLIQALLDEGRRVYVLADMPQRKLAAMSEGFDVVSRRDYPVEGSSRPLPLIELGEASGSPSAARDP